MSCQQPLLALLVKFFFFPCSQKSQGDSFITGIKAGGRNVPEQVLDSSPVYFGCFYHHSRGPRAAIIPENVEFLVVSTHLRSTRISPCPLYTPPIDTPRRTVHFEVPGTKMSVNQRCISEYPQEDFMALNKGLWIVRDNRYRDDELNGAITGNEGTKVVGLKVIRYHRSAVPPTRKPRDGLWGE